MHCKKLGSKEPIQLSCYVTNIMYQRWKFQSMVMHCNAPQSLQPCDASGCIAISTTNVYHRRHHSIATERFTIQHIIAVVSKKSGCCAWWYQRQWRNHHCIHEEITTVSTASTLSTIPLFKIHCCSCHRHGTVQWQPAFISAGAFFPTKHDEEEEKEDLMQQVSWILSYYYVFFCSNFTKAIHFFLSVK